MLDTYRCALRNSDCIACSESYGDKVEGVKITPVVLSCGHDLCRRCSERANMKCPSCKEISTAPPSGRLRVEYIKEAKESTKEQSEALAALTELVGKMAEHCDELEDVESIQEMKKTAKKLRKASMPNINGGQLKLIVSGVMNVVIKLCENLESNAHDKTTSKTDTLVKKEVLPIDQGAVATARPAHSQVPYLPTPPRDDPPSNYTQETSTGQTWDYLSQLGSMLQIPSYTRSPPSYRSNSQVASPKAVAAPKRQCAGYTVKGDRCSRTVAEPSQYCYQHVTQAYLKPVTRPSVSSSTNSVREGHCYGNTRSGEPCKIRPSVGNYCHVHIGSISSPTDNGSLVSFGGSSSGRGKAGYSAPPAKKSIMPGYDDYHSSAPASTFGGGQCQATTKQGSRCKRNATNGGYCYQHV